MSDMTIFIGIVFLVAAILTPVVLIYFRNSIVSTIGVSILFVAATIAIMAFYVAVKGLSVLIWITPIALAIMLTIIWLINIKLSLKSWQ